MSRDRSLLLGMGMVACLMHLPACSSRGDMQHVEGSAARETIMMPVEGYCPPRLEPVLRPGQGKWSPIPADSGAITIAVLRDTTESPVSGVQAEMFDDSAAAEAAYGRLTNDSGHVSWDAVPAGRYWVRLRYIGYAEFRTPVAVRPDGNDTLVVRLRGHAVGCMPAEQPRLPGEPR